MDEVERRKGEHLRVSAREDVTTLRGAGWGDVHLVHNALPEVDLDAVDLRVDFLGHRLSAPLAIAGMTGGHGEARTINAILARAAERFGLVMGVGSQRAGLRNPALADTYAVVRQEAPTAFLVANVGAAQTIEQGGGPRLSVEQVEAAVAMIGANALAVHLNFLEEFVQTEGDRRAAGCRAAIADLARAVSVPTIGKETGAGMSAAVARALVESGVSALDVGGVGGTSFAAVEAVRAEMHGDRRGAHLGVLFRDWGLPTAVSVVQAAGTGVPVIATGGVRSGLDAAKAIALGATLVGVARPLLQAALEGGDEAVGGWIEQFLLELRGALFLTGSHSPADLRRARPVVLGETADWLRQLDQASDAPAVPPYNPIPR